MLVRTKNRNGSNGRRLFDVGHSNMFHQILFNLITEPKRNPTNFLFVYNLMFIKSLKMYSPFCSFLASSYLFVFPPYYYCYYVIIKKFINMKRI